MAKKKPTKSSQIGNRKHCWWICVAVILAAVLALIISWLMDSESIQASLQAYLDDGDEMHTDKLARYFEESKHPPEVDTRWLSLSSNIAIKKWKNSSTLLSVVKSNKPTLIKHYTIRSWPMFAWNLLEIVKQTNISLNGTRWQPEPVFVLGQERDKGGMIGSEQDLPLSYTNITMEQFLSATLNPHNWLYWTGELSVWEDALGVPPPTPHTCGADHHDWRDLRIKEPGLSWNAPAVADNNSNVEESAQTADRDQTCAEDEENTDLWRPMLWLSHPGVVAQTHYDTQHNLFVQVVGSKRFLLFPPGTELYSYPNIHRSYRQSQVHLEYNTTATAPSTPSTTARSQQLPQTTTDLTFGQKFSRVRPSNTTAIEVTLHPGDVLYIPPYWQHRVESLTLALSLSILSPSYLEASFAEVYWENVPFGAFQAHRGLRTRAVYTYLSLLLAHTAKFIPHITLHEFAQELYETRFETLNIAHKEFRTCFETPPTTAAAASKEAPAESADALIMRYTEKFTLAASNVAEMLRKIDAMQQVKVVFLRDYVEQLVRWAVGHDYVASFLQKCLVLA